MRKPPTQLLGVLASAAFLLPSSSAFTFLAVPPLASASSASHLASSPDPTPDPTPDPADDGEESSFPAGAFWEEEPSWSSFDSGDDESAPVPSSAPPSTPSSAPPSFISDEVFLASISALMGSEEISFMDADSESAGKVSALQDAGIPAPLIESMTGKSLLQSEEEELVSAVLAPASPAGLTDDELKEVESHTTVDVDPDTEEPVRAQMVYVDEVTCIGCTNCAQIAQSTFFM
jgi:hypothetical protein